MLTFLWMVVIILTTILAFLGIYLVRQRKNSSSLKNLEDNLKNSINNLNDKYIELDERYNIKKEQYDKLLQAYEQSSNEKIRIDNEYVTSFNRIKDLNNEYTTKIKIIEDGFKTKIEALDAEYSKKVSSRQDEYEDIISRASDRCAAEMQKLLELRHEVDENRITLQIALEQNRLDNEEDRTHFIQISKKSEEELKELFDICNKLANPLPFRKAIYEVYFKTPLSTLVSDLGVKGLTGIYKITDTTNGKIYIGQSVDIAERWKQHVKRGCGAEIGTVSGSKFYNAMMENGLWNFKFELLEECTKENLNKKEKFWINYFNSTELGYNMKAGG